MGVIPKEIKYCTETYMLQTYHCSLYEECCNEGCCKPSPTKINFFLENFFYFWFAVVFAFLVCMYFCYWYWQHNPFRQGFLRNSNGSTRQPPHGAENISRIIHEVKDRTSSDGEDTPPPSYAQAVMIPPPSGNGISVIRFSTDNSEKPPPYESILYSNHVLPPLSIT